MAKESGLGMSITIDDNAGAGQDLSNDIQSCEVAVPRGVLDVTGVDKYAYERLLGLADGSATFNAIFNDAANKSHAVFKTIPGSTAASRTVVLVHSAQTLTMELLLTDYPLSRGDDGKLTSAVPGVLANGVAPAWT